MRDVLRPASPHGLVLLDHRGHPPQLVVPAARRHLQVPDPGLLPDDVQPGHGAMRVPKVVHLAVFGQGQTCVQISGRHEIFFPVKKKCISF